MFVVVEQPVLVVVEPMIFFLVPSITPMKKQSNKRAYFKNRSSIQCARISVDLSLKLISSFERFFKRAFFLDRLLSEGSPSSWNQWKMRPEPIIRRGSKDIF